MHGSTSYQRPISLAPSYLASSDSCFVRNAALWPDLPFCSAGNWEVVVAGGEDTGHSIGFRYSSVTNISVGKGRWAVYVVLCA
jgi:hypothetical protein